MSFLDVAILVLYFVVVLAVGLWFGRAERDTKDYFLGGRTQHWLLAGISIIATEISALTYVGVPADSYRGDWRYLQMYAGSFLGRILILFVLLPAFYGGRVTTVYQYLGQRFGPCTQSTAAVMFFVSRVLGSSIRLLAGSLALAVVFDWPLEIVLVGSAAVTVAYATFGGIKAILWTDLLQTIIFLGGAVGVIVYLFMATPGSPVETIAAAHGAGKFRVIHWTWNPNSEITFWVLAINALVQTMAAMGCDQDLTQRMLTCRDLRQGQKSLLFNALVTFPIVCVFLLIGVLLFEYYRTAPAASLPTDVREQSDRIFPYFIAFGLPAGLRGLLVTAIFAATMSSLASTIGALSSSAITDFYRPWLHWIRAGKPLPSEVHFLRAARGCSLVFGVILILVALAFAGRDQLLWEAFRWSSLLFGGMLGAFLLGVTTRQRGNDVMNMVFMLSSVGILGIIKFAQDRYGIVYIAWPWWVVLGTAWTYGLGLVFNTRKPRLTASMVQD